MTTKPDRSAKLNRRLRTNETKRVKALRALEAATKKMGAMAFALNLATLETKALKEQVEKLEKN